ncbi:hypothetical protein PTTG_07624 [Puccinia triticina 1-1 BBBD Race 1]|uniref:Uncharacterized protein n=1 Tax=Puccinia triticina (isolate 1-1 / race 1 (BBBD)) TaxID=630390 RepID=A0A0C4F3E5_PUCT1|nr:hypothetical protein PTTG_07624 [Puccinia triticina 1-1 BBBD Race 1]
MPTESVPTPTVASPTEGPRPHLKPKCQNLPCAGLPPHPPITNKYPRPTNPESKNYHNDHRTATPTSLGASTNATDHPRRTTSQTNGLQTYD